MGRKGRDIPILLSARTQHDLSTASTCDHSIGQWDGSFALLVLPSAGARSLLCTWQQRGGFPQRAEMMPFPGVTESRAGGLTRTL